MHRFFQFFVIVVLSYPAHAYLGPGMGGGVLASILGFLVGFLLLLFGVLYYPIKRFLKARLKDKQTASKNREDH